MVPPEPPGPTPIPVEGDVQIFADPECTTYADGTQSTVYVRVNNPWTEEWSVRVPEQGDVFQAFAAPYDFNLYYDWIGTQESEYPYVAGQIIAATNPQGGAVEPYFRQVVFTRQ